MAIYENLVDRTRSNPAKSQLFVEIGECEWTLDHQPESLKAFLKAAELDPLNTSAQLHLGQLFLAAGAPDKALVFAEIVLSHEPNNLDAMTTAAGAYAFMGKLPAATSRFEDVLKHDPARPDAVVTLSQIYATGNRVPDARNVLETAARKAPNSAPIQLAIAHFEEQQGRTKPAEDAYRKAVSLQDDADNNLALAQFLERSTRVPEAEAILRRVDTLRPAKPFALADFQLVSGKNSDASRQYLDLLLKPENAANDKSAATLAARAIEARLALASQQSGAQRDQSLVQARAALGAHRSGLGPDMTAVLAAEISLVQGDATTAEALTRATLESHADLMPAHYVLGLALSRQGKNSEARAEWQTVLDDDPNFVPARLSLAELALSENDTAAAERFVVPVVRQEPANLAALDLFGHVLIAEKDFSAANSIALRYQSIDKTSPKSHLLLAESALAQRRLAYSLIEYEQAILLDPNSPAAMDGLVRLYRMGNLTRSMLQHMERTAAAPPSSPALMELAGRLYAEHNWNDDAARCFRTALKIDPTRTTAAVQLATLESRTGQIDAASASAISPSGGLLISAVQAAAARNDAAAIRSYEQALEKGDDSGVAANNLAWIYAEKGTNLDRALELAQRARQANPVSPAVTDTLGYVFLRRREFSMAVAAFRHADELMRTQNSTDTELATAIHQHLNEAYKNSGQKIGSAAD